VIVYKWRIVLGSLAAASFLGTFAAGSAFASTASPDHNPVVRSAVLPAVQPIGAQLVPGAVDALNKVTALPAIVAVTLPVSGVLSALNQVTGPLNRATGPVNETPGLAPLTGVLPAISDATGALLAGVGNVASNLAGALLPAIGPAVGGLTAPVDGLSQDLGNLTGLPVLGTLISGVPALPDTGALLGDLNGLVNGVGTHVGS
jgi:hypothetical protein